jgi:PAS domain S-box-containing protein
VGVTPDDRVTMLKHLDAQAVELEQMIGEAIARSGTVHARRPPAEQQEIAYHLRSALREALALEQPTPLTNLLESALLRVPGSGFADTQRLFALTRRAVMELLLPHMGDNHRAVIELVELLGILLGAAREAEVERAINEATWRVERQALELQQSRLQLQSLIRRLPVIAFAINSEGHFTYSDGKGLDTLGLAPGQVVGLSALEMYAAFPEALALMQQALQGEEVSDTVPIGELIYNIWYQPEHDEEGRFVGTVGLALDITDRKQAERAQVQLQEQIIAAQQAALRELSTPIIPLGEGVIALPLIGSIDSARAQQIIENLLVGVGEHGASTAILDITGVQVVDTQVANALLRAAQSVKLLGANVIITGIRPEVAQTLVGLGLDLSGIVTLATLQGGIQHALRFRR